MLVTRLGTDPCHLQLEILVLVIIVYEVDTANQFLSYRGDLHSCQFHDTFLDCYTTLLCDDLLQLGLG